MRKNILKKTLSCILLVCLCISLCGCETWNNFKKAFLLPPEPPEYFIKIGVLEPKTGRQSYDAEDELAGMELAHELFPSVEGYRIELVYEDNRSNTEICSEAAQKLIDQGCCIVLGSVSDTLSLAASDIFKQNELPAIAATCTVPILTLSNPYYFRVSYINKFDAAGAAEYAINVLKVDKCAVILPEGDDYSKGKAELFEEEFLKAVGHDTFEYSYKTIDSETGEEIEAKAKSPTVYYQYIKGDETEEEMNEIFKQLDSIGYYSIYSPCKTETALPWINFGYHFDFTQNQEKPEVDPNDITTYSYWDEYGNMVTEEGYWNKLGQWVKYSPPKEEDKPLEEPKFFSWIGTENWIDILDKCKDVYENTNILQHVSYTQDYDASSSLTEISDTFLSKYHEKYGEGSTPSNEVALGFDAYLLAYQGLLDSITSTKLAQESESENENDDEDDIIDINSILFDSNGVFSRALLTRMLYRVKDMPGATGLITMDANGDPAKDINIEAFNGVDFYVVYTAHPTNTVKD